MLVNLLSAFFTITIPCILRLIIGIALEKDGSLHNAAFLLSSQSLKGIPKRRNAELAITLCLVRACPRQTQSDSEFGENLFSLSLIINKNRRCIKFDKLDKFDK